MKFVLFVIDDKANSATELEMIAINAFNEKLQKNGHWVYACGIVDPSQAYVIDFRLDSTFIESGSITSGKDFVSGFWIIEAENLEEAKRLAAQGSHACNRQVELREQL